MVVLIPIKLLTALILAHNPQSISNNKKETVKTQCASSRTSLVSQTSTSINTNGNIEQHDLSMLRVVLMLLLT